MDKKEMNHQIQKSYWKEKYKLMLGYLFIALIFFLVAFLYGYGQIYRNMLYAAVIVLFFWRCVCSGGLYPIFSEMPCAVPGITEGRRADAGAAGDRKPAGDIIPEDAGRIRAGEEKASYGI